MSKVLMLPIITRLWKNICCDLYKNTVLMFASTTIACCIIVGLASMSAMILVLDEVSVPNLADAFESAGPYSQVLVKIILNRFSLNVIRQLLNEIEDKFWPIDYFGPKIHEKQLETYRLIKYCLKAYIYTIYPSIIIICIRPLFMEERRYPLAVYHVVDPNNNLYYVVNYIVHIFGLFYAVGNFLAVDGLFALFVVNVLCQIIMLRHAFTSLNVEAKNKGDAVELYEKLKKYVDHHNLILDFIQKMSDLYSVQTFLQFVGNTGTICMGVFITSMAGMDDISTSMRAMSIVMSWFFQMAVYCIGGTLLTEACAKLADSMYDCGWEGPYREKFGFATEMVIMQAQKPNIMKAGKMFDVNLTTFSAVLRLSASMYTLLNSVTVGEDK